MKIFYNRTGFLTLLFREIHRFSRVSIQTILAPLISNILYLGIFSGILSTRSIAFEGFNYLQFLVPGLATMGAIFASFQNPSFSLISQKYMNTVQDLNSYPISDIEKTTAFILGGMVRGTLIGTLTYVATLPFVRSGIYSPVFFFFSLMLTSFVFSSIGFISGLALDGFEKMNFVLSIVITPMSYLGGVFFEISKLSGILSAIRFINPIYPLVNITRYAYLGVYEDNIYVHGALALIFMIISFTASLTVFKRGTGIKIQ
ncbi:ABC transporter permease [Alkalibacter saccharofermentans]|uniref:Transport permease protein n=1 Tax=Alkalibacter saccharofermentans DSM 14828 TaxID=1120975 RepID=A0A1M4SBD4_9FIRM|nr:ABC transporter permease [Alkalibacter saccharofermentans]SHE29533.1 ABC-2 type transport system permease protein [Alkalibacter saccharofermentans DSM 14828]